MTIDSTVFVPAPQLVEFREFPKIARLSRPCVITEKIDGTNAQIHILEDGTIKAGSRNRYLEPGKGDNFGFAGWVKDNETQLARLGPGRHYGEWWGSGIQRGYGLTEKRFSLFNVGQWFDCALRPACCSVVPLLWAGEFTTWNVDVALANLLLEGSKAAPGFMKPEGVVIFHRHAGIYFKKTLENDALPKGSKEAA